MANHLQGQIASTRLIIVGGFLGAGKTTLLLTAAQRLIARGYRVGLITNDQGEDLVDTALGERANIPVTEVAGGCFCCRFPDLVAALERLREVAALHLILAEPVGSCTDLVATVLRPLLKFYPGRYTLAPLTVLSDGTRDLDQLTPDVAYLYQQQLTEAELLLLNKCDQLSPSVTKRQTTALERAFPQATILPTSAKNGAGLEPWLDIVLGQQSRDPVTLVIDYDRYAKAEAALGWLNVKGTVRADEPFGIVAWTSTVLTNLADCFTDKEATIAHIKLLSTADGSRHKASLTANAGPLSWDGPEEEREEAREEEQFVNQLDFLLNVRVSAAPALLEQVVTHVVEQAKPAPTARYYFTHFECFSPLPPTPTHRLQTT